MRSKWVIFMFVWLFFGGQVVVAQNSQKRDVSAFSEISLRIDATVHLIQGNTQSVEVKGKENTLEKLITEVKERKLVIRYPGETKFSSWNPGSVDVYVTIPQVDGLMTSGSGSIISEGNIESRILDLMVSGSGTIKLTDLKSEKVSATLSGSGNIHLMGKQNSSEFKAVVSGSGNVKAIDFPVENVDLKISGSGNCWVNCSKKLAVRLVGSGNVIYRGNAEVESTILGSGKVKGE